MSKNRNWVFTLNNPVVDEVPKTWEGVKYCVWQKEKGAAGTLHLQGYIVFTSPRALGGLKKVCAGAHWEPRMGSHDQAKKYAMKEDTRLAGPWEMGVEPEVQGKRNDLVTVKEMLDSGKTLTEVADEHFGVYLKYSRSLKEYVIMKGMHERRWQTYTTVYWGPPGTGKSSRAHAEAMLSGRVYVMKQPAAGQGVFLDGYEGQETVIIDEFYGWVPYSVLLKMCDRYPCLMDTKGGMVPFYPKNIIICSNKPPWDWYKVNTSFDPKALQRRLEGECGKVVHMTVPCPGGWKFPIEVMSIDVPASPPGWIDLEDDRAEVLERNLAGMKRIPSNQEDDMDLMESPLALRLCPNGKGK